MAISDLLVPLFSLPLHLNHIINGKQTWIGGAFGEFTCKFVPFAVEVSTIVSIVTMIIIAAERFYCVHFPLKVATINKKPPYSIIAAAWVVSLALQSYTLFVRELNTENECVQNWEPTFNNNKQAQSILIIVLFVFQFVIPFAALAILYTMTIVTLRRKRITRHMSSRNLKYRESRNKKITLMAAIVALVFLIAWSPFWILMIRFMFVDGYFDCFLGLAIGPAVSSYTVVNPMVYFTFNEGYRRAMTEILCCVRKQSLLRKSTTKSGSRMQSQWL